MSLSHKRKTLPASLPFTCFCLEVTLHFCSEYIGQNYPPGHICLKRERCLSLVSAQGKREWQALNAYTTFLLSPNICCHLFYSSSFASPLHLTFPAVSLPYLLLSPNITLTPFWTPALLKSPFVAAQCSRYKFPAHAVRELSQSHPSPCQLCPWPLCTCFFKRSDTFWTRPYFDGF